MAGASARGHRKDWRHDIPPKQYQITVDEAFALTGNGNQLADAIGLTRSAVYQWKPPYRLDPYIPLNAAVRIMNNPELKKKLKEIRKAH